MPRSDPPLPQLLALASAAQPAEIAAPNAATAGPGARRRGAPGLDWIALSTGVALLVVLSAVLFATLGSPPKDDIAWLLHVAREWLAGRRLYADLVEVNPPLIVWLSALPVVLGTLTGKSPAVFAVGLVTAAVIGCAWWSATLLRGYAPLFRRRVPVFAVIAVVLLALPGVEFGQREHLLVALALPYLSLLAQRARGGAVPLRTALLVGVLAGLGCALKPGYALAFLLVELAAARAPAHLRRAESAAAASTLLAYAAAVAAFCPDYLRTAVPLALALYGGTDASLGRILFYSRTLLVGEAMALALCLIRPAALRRDPLLKALLVFGVGATAVYLLEGKDWFYHRIPAATAIVLTLAYWAARNLRSSPRGGRALIVHAAAACCALALFGDAALDRLAPRISQALAPDQTIEARLERIIRNERARSYMAFSQSLSVAFPVVDEAGVSWSSRFDSMWALRGELWRMRQDGGHAPRRWPVRQWIAADFLAHCPDLVVVDGGDGLDYPGILAAANPAFARAWTGYAQIGTIGQLHIFRRARSLACTPPPL